MPPSPSCYREPVPIARTAYERWLAPAYVRAMSVPAIRNRRAPFLSDLPYRFSYSRISRGLGRSRAVRILRRLRAVEDRTVLIVGDDTPGTLMRTLTSEGARRVICVDLYGRRMPGFPHRWQDISEATDGVAQFVVGDGRRLAIASGSVDTVCCESVLEHVADDDLEGMLNEFRRVLRPRGLIYVLWGPLWYSHGGPHIGALEYDHLLLPRQEFVAAAESAGNWWQSWFVRDDLFNRLTIDDYLCMIAERFDFVDLLLGGSIEAEEYESCQPAKWKQLRSEHSERALKVRHAQMVARRK